MVPQASTRHALDEMLFGLLPLKAAVLFLVSHICAIIGAIRHYTLGSFRWLAVSKKSNSRSAMAKKKKTLAGRFGLFDLNWEQPELANPACGWRENQDSARGALNATRSRAAIREASARTLVSLCARQQDGSINLEMSRRMRDTRANVVFFIPPAVLTCDRDQSSAVSVMTTVGTIEQNDRVEEDTERWSGSVPPRSPVTV